MDHTTWIEVSRDALARNYRAVATAAESPVCAVVKADAYGHGLVGTARILADAGAAMLGVTRLEEARAIRDAGIETAVLIMMPTHDAVAATSMGCAITVASADDVAVIPADAEVHLKIDTGMGRLGIPPADALDVARSIGGRARLAGVWTHFPDAAGPAADEQLATFRGAAAAVKTVAPDVTAHAANSAALLSLPGSHLDMVRVGTLLYGQNPPGATARWELDPTWTWYARVATVRTIARGGTVGYGSEWRASNDTRIATIPVGYADGFNVDPNARTPSNKKAARTFASSVLKPTIRKVWFGPVAAPVIGRIAMQALTVDVTGLTEVERGSIARIPARRMMTDSSIPKVYV